MKYLNICAFIISGIAIVAFLVITLLRISTIRTQAKKFGLRKEVTDPLLYWFSYISAFAIIIIKIIVWIYDGKYMSATKLIFAEILPTIALIVFTRTIGKTMIMRAEKNIYVNNLMSEVKGAHKLVKKNNKWTLYTATGSYPVILNNTSVYKIADITGASIEKEENNNSKL